MLICRLHMNSFIVKTPRYMPFDSGCIIRMYDSWYMFFSWWIIYLYRCIWNTMPSEILNHTLLAKKVVTPRDDVSFLWLFLFHQSARSKDRLFGVIQCFLCIWCPIFYSVAFCQFWRHLMIKWVIGRMCIPKCHWKIIVVNLVEQRWFFSWRCLVVSFCVCKVNIGYSRLSRR